MRDGLEDRLRLLVQATPWLVPLLEAVREVVPDGYVAAGAVRDTVWGELVGRPLQAPHADVDVVHWAARGPSEAELAERLRARAPDTCWEVVNQATVHEWIAPAPAVPFASVAEGMASWPETATVVGVRLVASGVLEVVAPLGLEDLFALRLRANPARGEAGRALFERRVRDKGWLQRFPELCCDGPGAGHGARRS